MKYCTNLLTSIEALDLKTKSPITVADGETQIKARLSSEAKAAYAAGLDGEDPMKGDILTCRQLTIISTPFGPPNDRVQLSIDQLVFEGVNARKTIGQPKPVLLRSGVQDLIAQTSRVRMQQYEEGWPAMPDHASAENEDTEREAEGAASHQRVASSEVQPAPKAAVNAAPQLQTQQAAFTQSPSEMNMMLQTQLPTAPTQTPTRHISRRGRGGLVSMGTHGVEPTHGINLAQPQAPALSVTKKRCEEKAAPWDETRTSELLNLLGGKRPKDTEHSAQATPPAKKRKITEQPTNQTIKKPAESPIIAPPEPSAPKSAEVPPAETVRDTPTQALKSSRTESSKPSTSGSSKTIPSHSRRKPHRIAADQRGLLNDKSCWVPSPPGRQFPHPNVPIGLLEAWKAKATAGSSDAPEPTPQVPIELSSASEESDHVEKSSVAGAQAAESSESELSVSEDDDDAPLGPWSQSPSQRNKLPPDSSLRSKDEEAPIVAKANNTPNASRRAEGSPTGSKRPMPAPERVDAPATKRAALLSTPLRNTPRSTTGIGSGASVEGVHRAAASAPGTASVAGTPASSESTPSKASTGQPVVEASPQLERGPQTPSRVMPIRESPQRIPETTQFAKPLGPDAGGIDLAAESSSSEASPRAGALTTWNGSATRLQMSSIAPKQKPENTSPRQQPPPPVSQSRTSRVPTGPSSQNHQHIPTGPRYPDPLVRRPPRECVDTRAPHLLPSKPSASAGDMRPLSTGKPPRTIPWSSQPDPSSRSINAQSLAFARSSQTFQKERTKSAAFQNTRHSSPSQHSFRSSTDSYRPPPRSEPCRDSWQSDRRVNDPDRPRDSQPGASSQPDSSGDLQMAPPRALRDFEDNDLRARRSNFYRGAMRKGW